MAVTMSILALILSSLPLVPFQSETVFSLVNTQIHTRTSQLLDSTTQEVGRVKSLPVSVGIFSPLWRGVLNVGCKTVLPFDGAPYGESSAHISNICLFSTLVFITLTRTMKPELCDTVQALVANTGYTAGTEKWLVIEESGTFRRISYCSYRIHF